jgi:hypothetical protein
LKIILNGVPASGGTTTEIINKAFPPHAGGLLHLNQNERTDFYVPLLKTALHRVIPNLAEISIRAPLPLAVEINWLL